MRFTSTAQILLATETARAIGIQSQAKSNRVVSSPLAHTPITSSLLASARYAKRANYLKNNKPASVNPNASLTQLPANQPAAKAKSLLQVGRTTADLTPVPSNAYMGASPEYMIVKRGDSIPDGYYLPTSQFVDDYWENMKREAGLIGDWAIIAFYGGKISGAKYGQQKTGVLAPIVEDLPAGFAEDYYAMDDPSISDTLIVAADPIDEDVFIPSAEDVTPSENIPTPPEAPDLCDYSDQGYDCNCVYVEPYDPYHRKPVFPDCPDYVDYEKDVPSFNAFESGLEGYSSDMGFTPLPDGYWGNFIFLSRPNLWGYDAWDEWKFGINIQSDGTVMDWCPVAGVVEEDVEGKWKYRFIYKIPDNDITIGDIEIGQCFTPIEYDGSILHGGFDPSMDSQQPLGHDFCIGTPDYGTIDFTASIIAILFGWADTDMDGCVNYDEFVGIIQYSAMTSLEGYQNAMIEFFGMCDVDGTGMMTWAEFNDCVDVMAGDDEEAEMMKTLFAYFDVQGASVDDIHGDALAEGEGDLDYRLTLDEMESGLDGISGLIENLLPEFNFWWAYFDLDSDECVTLPELEDGIRSQVDVTQETITRYWINYYRNNYSITEYWWWIFHTANGGFDWVGYSHRVPDGPAFDGKPMLFQTGQSAVTMAYIWFMHDECYFSLDYFGNEAPSKSGNCEIPGHKSIGFDYEWDQIEVSFEFKNNPEHAVTMWYQFGEWGPTGEHTDLRFFVPAMNYSASWLWERTDEYCDVCANDEGYPDRSYFGDGAEYTYYEQYFTEPTITTHVAGGSTTTDITEYGVEYGSETYTETTYTVTDADGTVTEVSADEAAAVEAGEEYYAPEYEYEMEYYYDDYTVPEYEYEYSYATAAGP